MRHLFVTGTQTGGGDPARLRLTAADWLLLGGVLLFYLATRLYAVEAFPPYFFCDEAMQAVLAEALVENGLHDQLGRFLPAYFLNVDKYSLGLTVWLYAIPVAVFGKSVVVVRATSACFSLLAAASLMLICKWFFRARLWWAAGLVLAALPAWFIHSRTGFEAPFMVSCYAAFLLTYLLYRDVAPIWLPAAAVCGAATFYSYTNGQGVMLLSAVLLLVVDWRYHLRLIRRRPGVAAAGVGVAVLTLVPYLHFSMIREPGMVSQHLQALQSYWLGHQSLGAKLATFGREYLWGLNPVYWFSEASGDLVRHRLPGTGHLPLWLAPLLAVGIVVCLGCQRSKSASRVVFVALVAAPFSAAVAGIQITRVLAAVVPATLLAVVGVDWLASRARRFLPIGVLGVLVGLGLAGASLTLCVRAVSHGATWTDDYGLYGLQWGAPQVFARIRELMAEDPSCRVGVDGSWANNPFIFGDFFLDDDERSRLLWLDVRSLVRRPRSEVAPGTVFVLSSSAYREVQESEELEIIDRVGVLDLPNGEPGFIFVRLGYTPEAAGLMEARRDPRRSLVAGSVEVGGRAVGVRYPELDTGSIDLAFDGDPETLARTRDAQTTIVELHFPEPRPVDGVRLQLWTGGYGLGLAATTSDGQVVQVRGSGSSPVGLGPIELWFLDHLDAVTTLEIEISKAGDGHVHLREIEVLPDLSVVDRPERTGGRLGN